MPRGGKRLGAGRKRTRRRYKRRESIGETTFEIGRLCEELRHVHGDRWKKIFAHVAEEFKLSYGVVERLYKDYRQLKADLKADLKDYQPDTNNCHVDDTV